MDWRRAHDILSQSHAASRRQEATAQQSRLFFDGVERTAPPSNRQGHQCGVMHRSLLPVHEGGATCYYDSGVGTTLNRVCGAFGET
jgi:hypothetical protein